MSVESHCGLILDFPDKWHGAAVHEPGHLWVLEKCLLRPFAATVTVVSFCTVGAPHMFLILHFVVATFNLQPDTA